MNQCFCGGMACLRQHRRPSPKRVLILACGLLLSMAIYFAGTTSQLKSAVTTTITTTKAKLEDLFSSSRAVTFRGRLVRDSSTIGDDNSSFPCIDVQLRGDNLRFPMCTFGSSEWVSRAFHNGGYYEADIVVRIMKLLRHDDGRRPRRQFQLIDIGANIGTYALAAARLTRVIAVEPNAKTVKRLCRSAELGRIEHRLWVVNNAVSDERSVVSLNSPTSNRGQTAISAKQGVACTDGDACPPAANNELVVNTIFLDDLLPLVTVNASADNPPTVVIKVDVQGHEIHIFNETSAAEIFSVVDIPVILMEWDMFVISGSRYLSNEDEARRVDDFLGFFYRRKYSAFTLDNKLLERNWKHWPYKILIKNAMYADYQF